MINDGNKISYTSPDCPEGKQKHVILVNDVAVGIAVECDGGYEFEPTPDLRFESIGKIDKLKDLEVKISEAFKTGTKPSYWEESQMEEVFNRQKK